ncbi:hypothetical protein CRG98_025128 [Punica granatum]|uniref:Uncharacterized protein n=1 Tax=Punica granatum TaxID=22663 RepID=A0A2I0JEX2_PUNGR|nr:hypothetical protein CRG98_025128 [Punica granatum]
MSPPIIRVVRPVDHRTGAGLRLSGLVELGNILMGEGEDDKNRERAEELRVQKKVEEGITFKMSSHSHRSHSHCCKCHEITKAQKVEFLWQYLLELSLLSSSYAVERLNLQEQ